MKTYDILLADDHVLLRQGLKRIIEEADDLKVVGEAGDGLEALSFMKKIPVQMVILDISMPNLRGLEAIREIKVIQPRVKILVLTMHKDKGYMAQAIAVGAEGYLLKEDADLELFSAIRRIQEGGLYISPHLSEMLVSDWARTCRGDSDSFSEYEQLTLREVEVLKLIAEGKSSKNVADLLFISVRTAERHRANIMQKLKLKKMPDLIRYAMRKGYL
jgi:DNA-binding NarL/FixJ family response regulator